MFTYTVLSLTIKPSNSLFKPNLQDVSRCYIIKFCRLSTDAATKMFSFFNVSHLSLRFILCNHRLLICIGIKIRYKIRRNPAKIWKRISTNISLSGTVKIKCHVYEERNVVLTANMTNKWEESLGCDFPRVQG